MLFEVLLLRLKLPEEILKFPSTEIVPVAVLLPAPLILILLKLLALIVLAASPLKLIVDPVAINVPLFIQLPFIECVKAPAVKVVPNPTVIFPFIINPEDGLEEAEPLSVKSPEIVVAPD